MLYMVTGDLASFIYKNSLSDELKMKFGQMRSKDSAVV